MLKFCNVVTLKPTKSDFRIVAQFEKVNPPPRDLDIFIRYFDTDFFEEEMTLFKDEYTFFNQLYNNSKISTGYKIQVQSCLKLMRKITSNEAYEAVRSLKIKCLPRKRTVDQVPDFSKLIAFWDYVFASRKARYTPEDRRSLSWKEYCKRHLDIATMERQVSIVS